MEIYLGLPHVLVCCTHPLFRPLSRRLGGFSENRSGFCTLEPADHNKFQKVNTKPLVHPKFTPNAIIFSQSTSNTITIMSSWHNMHGPTAKNRAIWRSSLSEAFLPAAGICHTDFHEYVYLKSQPNLLKAIRSLDNLVSWAQQPKPQSASNAEFFHHSTVARPEADSEILRRMGSRVRAPSEVHNRGPFEKFGVKYAPYLYLRRGQHAVQR